MRPVFRLGYNTNGLAHNSLNDILIILHELGYNGLALTLDHPHGHPYQTRDDEFLKIREQLARYDLAVVIETGARYLLNRWHKHEPTLLSDEYRERVRFLKRAIDIAKLLNAEAVSFFSGIKPVHMPLAAAESRLIDACREICDYAREHAVTLGFEPEPGMLIDSMARFEEIRKRIDRPNLKLTLDIGHLFCTEPPGGEADVITRFGTDIVNIHIEDIKNREHNHLAFGEGDIDFRPIFSALRTIGYTGLINVELSRDSHRGPVAARESKRYLDTIIKQKP